MKKKKVYSTPEGLHYSASCTFSNSALAWLANMIWQFLLQVIHVSGTTSMLLNLVGFALLLYGSICAYMAFDCEMQADALEHENVNKALTVMKKAVMICIGVRIVLAVISIITGILFRQIKGSPAYAGIDALINIFGNIFTCVNVLGIFAYKLFIAEGYDGKVKIYSLISFIAVIAHFLLAELRYFLIVGGSGSNFLNYTALISAVISYFALFLLFEARKVLYKKSETQENSDSEAR